MEQKRGKFNSNFGFLMVTIGTAVGLGNLWSFPYKMGVGGGFAFLLIYIVMAIFVGYPLMMGEIALGRKTQKAAIAAFEQCDSRFKFVGFLEMLVPFCLLCFYCTFGGYVIKYFVANLGDIFGASWGVGGTDSGEFFGTFISSGAPAVAYGLLFLVMTSLILVCGVAEGLERFSKFAMPVLFVMLLIVVVRSCTLPGAMEGVKFIFTPDFTVFEGKGWLKVLGLAGSQMFFSLSLGSSAVIAFGSYLNKDANIEQNSLIIPFADTIVAVLSGLAVMPAVFAYGLQPASGPSLLFVSLQAVFNGMGRFGTYFGAFFYLLVFFAAISSSIGMMEGGIAPFTDMAHKKGKKAKRHLYVLFITCTGALGSTLVSMDALGSSGFWHPFGLKTWLDFFDLLGEGIFMPLGSLLMTIVLGWTRRHYIDDEIALSSPYRSRKFVNLCLRYIAPVFMVLLIIVQLNSFFNFTDLI
ncbi:MAG: sodium-dependent transporter [Clostridia bacterium]|nr:sodium-dependent transporter [Clostridia bacterium]MDO5302334.1 sodium-dependent transporter [Clostridia bacterium]